MEFQTLLYGGEDGVAILTFDRPERRNAFDRKIAEEFGCTWSEIDRDPDVACVVVTGSGDRTLRTVVEERKPEWASYVGV